MLTRRRRDPRLGVNRWGRPLRLRRTDEYPTSRAVMFRCAKVITNLFVRQIVHTSPIPDHGNTARDDIERQQGFPPLLAAC